MISIIVPIYKAEKYLHRCIDSILAQTYQEWELLLIDDGSPDSSGDICDEYAAKDSRIRVFHKPNGGVSSARNLGLDNANGDWIVFIDADDYVNELYLDAVNDSDADIIMLTSMSVVSGGEMKTLYTPAQAKYSGEELRCFLAENLYSSSFKTPWGKIISRNVIAETRFRLNQKLGEDSLFMYDIYRKTHVIECNPAATYYWLNEGVVDSIKYKMSVATAESYLSEIITSYKKIGIVSPYLESNYLGYFFTLIDKEDFKQNMSLWFESDVVKSLQVHAKTDWPTYRYFFYIIWKYPIIATYIDKLYLSIRRIFVNS